MNDPSAENPESGDDFGLSAVRELLRLMNQTDITEILIERGDTKLHVKRSTAVPIVTGHVGPVAAQPIVPVAPAPVQPLFAPQPAPESAHIEMPVGHTIAAPMVGTFYAATSPKDPPFVREGDEIHAGELGRHHRSDEDDERDRERGLRAGRPRSGEEWPAR